MPSREHVPRGTLRSVQTELASEHVEASASPHALYCAGEIGGPCLRQPTQSNQTVATIISGSTYPSGRLTSPIHPSNVIPLEHGSITEAQRRRFVE